VHRALNCALKDSGVLDAATAIKEFIQRQGDPSSASTATSATTPVTPTPPNVHIWGGRFRYVPADFEFPKGTVQTAWHHYVMGDTVNKKYGPLRRLDGLDLSTKNQRRRLSDFKFILSAIEQGEG